MASWRKIIDSINNEINTESYTLAVSGGVDSMFMLNFFHRNCKKELKVAHFDHKIRPTSWRERNLVLEICAQLNISCFVGYGDSLKITKSDSIEAEARKQRIEFFKSISDKNNVVVTAQHANDQVETVLLNLMRGKDHLRMEKITKYSGLTIYRPFLNVTKEEIVKEAIKRNVKWIEDESNTDTKFERNWLRNVIIPQLMERRNLLKTIGRVE